MKRPYRSPFQSRDEEIARLRKQVEQLTVQPILEQFAVELGEAMATILAATAYPKWPAVGKAAYQHCERRTPTAAHLYLANLPKE